MEGREGEKKSDWLRFVICYAYSYSESLPIGFETMAEKDITRFKLLLSTICVDPSITNI